MAALQARAGGLAAWLPCRADVIRAATAWDPPRPCPEHSGASSTPSGGTARPTSARGFGCEGLLSYEGAWDETHLLHGPARPLTDSSGLQHRQRAYSSGHFELQCSFPSGLGCEAGFKPSLNPLRLYGRDCSYSKAWCCVEQRVAPKSAYTRR